MPEEHVTDLMQDDVVSVQRGGRRLEKDTVRGIEFHPKATQLFVCATHSFDFLDEQRATSMLRYGGAEFLQIEGGRNFNP
ncbi:hypothetical protein ACFY3J_17460 [Streptomyces sp. NPDC001231]|uniref:hypothetical protein n=1 Tax=Streptomyces sp. NPDC001231 TaxID=3364549 RepID=UPI0036ACDBE1